MNIGGASGSEFDPLHSGPKKSAANLGHFVGRTGRSDTNEFRHGEDIPGGSMSLNTNGAACPTCIPTCTACTALQENVRQMRGAAPAQIPAKI
jgi:hypothetical protein